MKFNSYTLLLKKTLKDLVSSIKKLAYSILTNNIVYIAENSLTKTGFTLVRNKRSLARYQNLYLGTGNNIKLRRRLILDRSAIIKQAYKAYGIAIIPTAKLVSDNSDALIVPDFIDLKVLLPANINTFYQSLAYSARHDIKRIEKEGFLSSVSKDITWLKTFYFNYYVPSMQVQHGDEAYIMSKSEMHNLMQKANTEFIKVYLHETCVAAGLIEYNANTVYFRKVGWLNADYQFVKKGAVASLYWFIIQRAFELNCKEIIWGGTPAYLESGVLKYKSKWNSTFMTSNYIKLNQLLLNPDHPQCYQFLKETSLIAVTKHNSLIVLSSKSRDQVNFTGPILNEFANWYILRDQKMNYFDNELTELPVPLRCWYQKV